MNPINPIEHHIDKKNHIMAKLPEYYPAKWSIAKIMWEESGVGISKQSGEEWYLPIGVVLISHREEEPRWGGWQLDPDHEFRNVVQGYDNKFEDFMNLLNPYIFQHQIHQSAQKAQDKLESLSKNLEKRIKREQDNIYRRELRMHLREVEQAKDANQIILDLQEPVRPIRDRSCFKKLTIPIIPMK